ncbi:hypothetical protein NW762_006252 [Fusarium torreyae]|uniref:NmrA-like domain-containing protein n=1 Tax=Fusarium torreyae TaxID=1237075 RepID=A0A9W8VE74_9HYPO|nr:hypothetical protein NW762_006252 [Fusarium torreyae]
MSRKVCITAVDGNTGFLIAELILKYRDFSRKPRLREFADLETIVMEAKGDPGVSTGTSPCIIRAGFYVENLLLYAPQAKEEGVLPLPIGDYHKFAPVALSDVAQVAAHVLTGKVKHGFDDRHRGQMIVPHALCRQRIAAAASKAFGTELQFENISHAEAKRVLKSQSELDQSEQQYLLEYYGPAKEGNTNYISTSAFHDVTGEHPTEPENFFKIYEGER